MQAVDLLYSGKYVVKDHPLNHSTYNSDPSLYMRSKFPHKIPVILERARKEKELPKLEFNRYLVPEGLTLGHLQAIIRKRLKLKPTMALFFLVNNNLAVAVTKNMTEIYNELKQEDGFLHITYASQDVFG